MYHHRTRDDRVALGALRREGLNQSEIARHLGVHRSTVCRELVRNARADGTYHARRAHRLAKERRKLSKERARLIENHESLATLIEALLDPLVSPEVIGHELGIAHETVYAWISRSRPDLLSRLAQRGRKRRKYGSKRARKQGWTKNVRSIDERPEDEGWEGDTIKGSTRPRVLTHVHTSLFIAADLLPDGTADTVHATLKRKQHISGLTTYDRGSEFALWEMMERDTTMEIYFAHAQHPQERGRNENTNGRLRRVYPKRFDFSTITQRDLDAVVDLMNHTPRKSRGWQMPCRLYGKACCTSD